MPVDTEHEETRECNCEPQGKDVEQPVQQYVVQALLMPERKRRDVSVCKNETSACASPVTVDALKEDV
jgi:hypothetical protein